MLVRGRCEQAWGAGGVHSPWGKELAHLRAGQVWSLGPSRAPGAEWERWALGMDREASSPRVLDKSGRAAVIKYHRLGGLNSRNLFSHSSGGWKSKMKVLAVMVSPEAAPLGLQMTPSLLCPRVIFPLCLQPWCFLVCLNLLFL